MKKELAFFAGSSFIIKIDAFYMLRSGGPGYRMNVDQNCRENKKDKKKIILFQKTIA
jgi:hypothetical protein